MSVLLEELVQETNRYLNGEISAAVLDIAAAARIQESVTSQDKDAEELADDIIAGLVWIDEQIITLDEFKNSLRSRLATLEVIVT